MNERWEYIPGFEGYYEVSNHGRIRSVTRAREVKNRYGSTQLRIDRGQPIIPNDNGHGYMQVRLCKDGKRSVHYVHRLVANVFCKNPNGYNVVNHKDHNKRNNHSINLEWCTQKENILHSASLMCKPKTTHKKSNTGEKYIRIYARAGRNPRYRVSIRTLGICKEFQSLCDAIKYRNEVMAGV